MKIKAVQKLQRFKKDTNLFFFPESALPRWLYLHSICKNLPLYGLPYKALLPNNPDLSVKC
jgi:hypothetical protein